MKLYWYITLLVYRRSGIKCKSFIWQDKSAWYSRCGCWLNTAAFVTTNRLWEVWVSCHGLPSQTFVEVCRLQQNWSIYINDGNYASHMNWKKTITTVLKLLFSGIPQTCVGEPVCGVFLDLTLISLTQGSLHLPPPSLPVRQALMLTLTPYSAISRPPTTQTRLVREKLTQLL